MLGHEDRCIYHIFYTIYSSDISNTIKGLGSSLLLYGHVAPKSVLLFQGLKAVGFPLLKEKLNDLRSIYKRTRGLIKLSSSLTKYSLRKILIIEAKIEENGPDIRKHSNRMIEITKELVKLKEEYDTGKIKKESFLKKSNILRKDLEESAAIKNALGNSLLVTSISVIITINHHYYDYICLGLYDYKLVKVGTHM